MSIFKYNMIIMGWLQLQYGSIVFSSWPNTFGYHRITIELQYDMTPVFNHINCPPSVAESLVQGCARCPEHLLNTSRLSRPTSWVVNCGWKWGLFLWAGWQRKSNAPMELYQKKEKNLVRFQLIACHLPPHHHVWAISWRPAERSSTGTTFSKRID